MKRKNIIILSVIILCVAILIIGGFLFFKPVPIISSPYTIGNPDSYSESDVAVSLVNYYGADVTGNIDMERFVAILSNYNCKRSFSKPFPYPAEDMVWEINYAYKFKPVHIVLGKDSVRYEDGNDIIIYRIINPDSLIDELSSTLQPDIH